MSFRINDKELLKRYSDIWGKISNLLGKDFHRNPYYVDKDKKYINFKLKTFNDNITTNFHEKRIPKTNIAYDCFLLINLDSVIRVNGTYHPQYI